jgi:uncharacterized protein (DUF924 family)
MPDMTPAGILDFWFGADAVAPRGFWFSKSDAIDTEIRSRFGAAVEEALAGSLDDWAETPEASLALILLLDQFTRNIFRGTPRAFAGDEAALGHAQRLVQAGLDRRFDALRRWFIYLPFEHSERLDDQNESLRLFGELAREGEPGPLEWAQKHFDVIRRFGRFPHRNEILGRASTPEETEFLRQPGSRF